MLMQFTFQLVLSTDGRRSFAMFLYEYPDSLPYLLHQIGFNAGDRFRWSNIQADSLENVNIYRIDGMNVCIEKTKFLQATL